ncbi:hypothetical protein [Nakamurella sp.]|uniref:hypothetical protein n=1 Tax=Nakamurella sp. TaxID=1869182 RepID=UPI003B3BD43D
MFKRIGSVVAMAATGLIVAAGTAAAAPVYAPPGLSAVSINVNQIVITGTNYGDESGPDTSVDITITYGGPSGLRSSAGLSAAGAAATLTAEPDADGNWSVTYNLTQDGDLSVRAVGSPSGDDLTVFLADPPGVPGQTGSGYTGSGSGSGQNYSSGYASGDVSSGYAGLASTGASIGAPLAIGIGALLAGLVLLFFGTRGVLRRKGAKSGASG